MPSPSVAIPVPLQDGRAALPTRPAAPSRALAWFGALVLLVVWAALALVLRDGRQEALRAEARQDANLARTLQEQTERVIATADQATLRLAAAVGSGQDARPDLVRFANETGLAPRILVQLSLVGPDGVFLGSNLDPDARKTGAVDLSDREHVKVHLAPLSVPEAARVLPANGLFIGKPVLGKVSKRWTIQLSRRIAAPDGQPLGVVVASLDPAYFEQVYARVALGAAGGVTLVGSDRQVRARVIGGQPQGMGQSLSSASPLARPGAGAEGEYLAASTIDGVERLYAYRKIGDYPLFVAVSTGVDDALADWRATRNGMLVLALLLSLAIVAGGAAVVAGLRRLERAHEALRVSEARAQVANQAKTEFLAAMSHELRTPLTSMRGFAELLEQRLEQPAFREQAGLIRKGAERLDGLLSDILDLTQLEAGALAVRDDAVSPRALLADCAGLFEVCAAAKGLRLSVHCSDDLPQQLRGDRLRLKQIVDHLLANAVKFTSAGEVRLVARVVGAEWRCDVVDTGPGIPREQQALVFETFRQAHGRISHDHGGTGLGLALSRSLAERLGGRLTLQSEPGAGARFTLAMPMVAVA